MPSFNSPEAIASMAPKHTMFASKDATAESAGQYGLPLTRAATGASATSVRSASGNTAGAKLRAAFGMLPSSQSAADEIAAAQAAGLPLSRASTARSAKDAIAAADGASGGDKIKAAFGKLFGKK
ncbi:hypothetical protein HK405_010100 [Cladochytrium tenue]|nr:hypothetical protein HK405_010100 [Cladochytrium tenue]